MPSAEVAVNLFEPGLVDGEPNQAIRAVFEANSEDIGLIGLTFGAADGQGSLIDASTLGGTADDTAVVINDSSQANGVGKVLAALQDVAFTELDDGNTRILS